jgi:hypothetical protein
MFPSLAPADIAVSCLVLLGLALFVVGEFWFLIVAAKRSVLWLIAVLLLQIASFILLFVEPKSRLPFLVVMLGIGFGVGGHFGANPEMRVNGRVDMDRVISVLERETIGHGSVLSGDEGTLEERKVRIRAWQAQLEAKKAALKPADTTAQAAFSQEFQQYLAALEKVKAEMAAQPKP